MAADTQQLQGEVNDSPQDHASLIPVELMLKGLLAALIEEERSENPLLGKNVGKAAPLHFETQVTQDAATEVRS